MRLVLLAKKGGVGKSTLALLLHEALRQAGKVVAIRDWDAQGTSNKALRLLGTEPAVLDATYDVLLYDTPPSLEHVATGYAVQQSDVAVVVTSPSPADIWEAEEAVQFVRAHNRDAEVRLVFNKVRKGTVLTRLTAESAKEVSAPALSTMVSDRECYKHAIGEGWKALDGAAREEVLQLTVALLSLGR
jgi:MinD-like ATPase involved in chromosome partitioning or flagellar assembly